MKATGKVVRVIDGDTMWVRVRIRTRASAEPATTAAGAAQTAELKKRFPKGTTVNFDTRLVDSYGRILATPALGGVGVP